jgi:alanine dehydrogenase
VTEAPTIILHSDEIRALVSPADCIAAVEAAFREHGRGEGPAPAVLGIRTAQGGFHVKAAVLRIGRLYFAAKLNANFPANPARYGWPTIQGVVALADGENGRLLALMDSGEITRLRTGAATAVAARHLARPDSAVLTVFGCGRQSLAQVECLSRVLPLRRMHAFDRDAARAEELARAGAESLGLEAGAVAEADAFECARESDVVVTCTPARRAFLGRSHIGPGTFVAAVGADDADKQEIEPALLAASTVVADVLAQCAVIGDLHHAIDAGVMRVEDVHAELADVVTGRKPGRTRRDEIVVFDSTGTALEDVAAAALVYERAVAGGRGRAFDFAGSGDAIRS